MRVRLFIRPDSCGKIQSCVATPDPPNPCHNAVLCRYEIRDRWQMGQEKAGHAARLTCANPGRLLKNWVFLQPARTESTVLFHPAFDIREIQSATAIVDNNQILLNVAYIDAARPVIDDHATRYALDLDSA